MTHEHRLTTKSRLSCSFCHIAHIQFSHIIQNEKKEALYGIQYRTQNKITGKTAKMKHPQYVRRGTVRAIMDLETGKLVPAEQTEADIDITYNYSHYYYEATDGDIRFAHEKVSAYLADGTQGPVETEYGIRGLYGSTPAEST